VTASEYGIKPVTNLFELPPVHGQHIPTEYQYLIKMNPEDLHGQMVALFGELEYELKEETTEENSKKYKQMTTIDLDSCSIEKGEKFGDDKPNSLPVPIHFISLMQREHANIRSLSLLPIRTKGQQKKIQFP
jgi:hypothetical protein